MLVGVAVAGGAGIGVFSVATLQPVASWTASQMRWARDHINFAAGEAFLDILGNQTPGSLGLWASGFITTTFAIPWAASALRRAAVSTEPLPPTPEPPGVHNLPAPSAVFVGRDMEQVHSAFTASAGVIVTGLGGIGKTELAAQYAHAHAIDYPLRWWILADNPDNITRGLADLAQRLDPAESLKLDQAREWAIRHLQIHPGWLLIFDNVNDINDIDSLLGELHGNGKILVTTRRDIGDAAFTQRGLNPIRLGVLDRTASLDLLARLLDHEYETESAYQLAQYLGDLPLALTQASAYVSQNPGLGIAGYLQLLTDPATHALATTAEGTTQDRAVANTWTITVAAIARRDPLARRVLDILAYLAPDSLPDYVLTPLAPSQPLRGALALLASYSMITRTDGAISVHRLVQAITRDHQRAAGQPPEALTTAIDLLAQAVPDDNPRMDVSGWPTWRALLPHVEAATGHLPSDHTDATALDLRQSAGQFLEGQGQLTQAIALFEVNAADYLRVLGSDDPVTLRSRNDLARAYEEAGQLDKAILLHEVNLADQLRVLGSDDPDTLTSRNNLALAYTAAGRLADAIELHDANLLDRIRVLGPDHPQTLTARNNLAAALKDAGRLDRAIELYETNLAETVRVLGPDHPQTLLSRNNLARAYQDARRLVEAVTMFEANLADRLRVLGPDHPDTLVSRSVLAAAYQDAGRLAEAAPMFEANLTHALTVLGPDHPQTLQFRNDLAGAYREAGRPDEAIELYETNLADGIRVLGPDHPDTLSSRNNLAVAYTEAGRLADAIELHEINFADRIRVLGPDHPSTLASRDNLAGVYEAAARQEDADALYDS